VIDDADAAEVGQVGREHRERRANARERLTGFGGRPRRSGEQRPHLRIGVGHFAGEARETFCRRTDVVAALDLRIQERPSLVDQRRGLRPARICLIDEQPRRLDHPREFRPGPVERLERLAQQILEPSVVEAAHQLVGLVQQLGDVLRERSALLRDGGTVTQHRL
jgi:hypothetical protein